jgi:glycosyltransferase involved in cell wall biosynthesis
MSITSDPHPDLIMETSWEVCNKVGGIYTVLSTRAATMVERYGSDGVLFVGPWIRTGGEEERMPADFRPDASAADEEKALSEAVGLPLRLGHWVVPGEPRAILVDYDALRSRRDVIYFVMWEKYGIDSSVGYGDYEDSCLFAVAAAKVMMAYHRLRRTERSVALFNEWTTGMGLLWLKHYAPELATLFITHATTVGRSIAGNGKKLYAYMPGYSGDQMAAELGVAAKHTLEKCAAHEADLFAAVSEVTAVECRQLLDKEPDMILPNGFEPAIVPDASLREAKRRAGRERICRLAGIAYGKPIDPSDALLLLTSGRHEYRNKGIDLFIDAMKELARRDDDGSPRSEEVMTIPEGLPAGGAEWLEGDRHTPANGSGRPLSEGRAKRLGKETMRPVVALIAVPSWIDEPRTELAALLDEKRQLSLPASTPYLTHRLHNEATDEILCHLRAAAAEWGKAVYPLFVSAYLDGADGVLDIPYYDLLPAVDLTIFPSYYEPWGYTPLESIAFGIPTITTDKAGFSTWTKREGGGTALSDGALVLARSDDHTDDLVEGIAAAIEAYADWDESSCAEASAAATELAARADWAHFFAHYEAAFADALAHHQPSSDISREPF